MLALGRWWWGGRGFGVEKGDFALDRSVGARIGGNERRISLQHGSLPSRASGTPNPESRFWGCRGGFAQTQTSNLPRITYDYI